MEGTGVLTREEREKLKIDAVIELCYDYIFAISEDRILATHGSNISLITIDGEMICTYDSIYAPTYPTDTIYYDEEEGCDRYVEEFIDDLLVFVENGKHGIMDYDGDIIVEAKYSDITFSSEGTVEILP